jgi:hypothetical protein
MSNNDDPGGVLLDPLEPATLRRLVERHFENMVKFVVDLERGVAAVGGELHADEEAVLLAQGSNQEDLWGANYYPAADATAASSSPRSSTSGPPRAIAL